MYSMEFEIPNGVNVEISGSLLKVKGPKGEVDKKLELTKDLKLEKLDNKIKISTENDRRVVKSLIGTNIANIKNAVKGATDGFVYKLKVVYSHFPVTVKVEGRKVLISNFLGERVPRIASIVGKAEVKIEGADITVSGNNLDEVSQTAGNIELTTRITGYDKKVFQDGCYIVSKGEDK